eukprot:UC1_evm3s1756
MAAAATAAEHKDTIPTLYSYWRSSCSYRVRIALALKGIDYQYQAVNLLKAEQTGDEYAAVNPMREVPTLHCDGQDMTQSCSIIQYLDETRPGGGGVKLLPDDPALRYKARQLAEVVASGTQPVQVRSN